MLKSQVIFILIYLALFPSCSNIGDVTFNGVSLKPVVSNIQQAGHCQKSKEICGEADKVRIVMNEKCNMNASDCTEMQIEYEEKLAECNYETQQCLSSGL